MAEHDAAGPDGEPATTRATIQTRSSPPRYVLITAAIAFVVAACPGRHSGGAAAGIHVTEQRVSSKTSQPLVGIGRRLVARDATSGHPADALLTTADLGRHWATVALPGAPGAVRFQYASPQVVASRAVVRGRDTDHPSYLPPPYPGQLEPRRSVGAMFVWTSGDGQTWQLVPMTPGGPDAVEAVAVDGRLLLVGTTRRPFSVFTSDGASPWRPSEIRGLALGPDEEGFIEHTWTVAGEVVVTLGFGTTSRRAPTVLVSRDLGHSWTSSGCFRSECVLGRSAGRLAVRGEEVSVDGGTTWQRATFVGSSDVRAYGTPAFTDVVAVDGGWLATATVGTESAFEHLYRSTDGTTWHRLLAPDPCVRSHAEEPNSTLTTPVQWHGRWLVIYACTATRDASAPVVSAKALVGEPNGQAFRPIDLVQRGARLGESFVLPDEVVIPILGQKGPTVDRLLLIRRH